METRFARHSLVAIFLKDRFLGPVQKIRKD